MRRIIVFILLALAVPCFAQRTTVTGTVTGTNNQPYANCQFNVDFVSSPNLPPGVQYTFGGNPSFQTSYPGSRCDGFGNFSIQLPDNNVIQPGSPYVSQWRFQFQSGNGYVAGPYGCQVTVTITGGSQDISSIIQPACPPLPPGGGGGSGVVSLCGSAGPIYYSSGIGAVAICDPNTNVDGSGNATFKTVTVGSGTGIIDYTVGASPGNPSAGKDRTYADQISGVTCLSTIGCAFSASRQFWLNPGIVAPTLTLGGTGTGNLANNHTIRVIYTLSNAAGESLPSVEASVITNAGTNSVVVTAPTLPTGYANYTVYSSDNGNPGSELQQTALAACVNITGNCTIQTGGAGAAPPAVGSAYVQPSNAQGGTHFGETPSAFFPKVDGNYYPWLSMDTVSCDATSGPPLPCGTPVFMSRTYFNDIGAPTVTYPNQLQAFKNAFVSINHGYGNGTVLTNQDRALGMLAENQQGDSATHYSMTVAQLENDIFGNPTFSSHVDTEVETLSLQGNDSTTAAPGNAPAFVGIIRGMWTRQDTGGSLSDGSGVVAIYRGIFNNNSTTAFPGGTVWAHSLWVPTQSGGGNNNTNLIQEGFRFNLNNITRSGTANRGIYAYAGNSTFTPTSADNFLRNDIHNWNSLLNGNVGLNQITNTDQQALPLNASLNVIGSITVSQIASSWTSGYTNACSGGASTYAYTFVAVDNNGGQSVSAATNNCTTGTNPLTVGNPATLTFGSFTATQGAFAQAIRIDVYRTSGPMTTGKIGSLTCANNLPVNGCSNFVDTGLSASGSLPTLNTTGSVQGQLFSTTTNCTAVGSAASPSIAACGTATAGHFSCATNATGATCQVNTTAVTANSEIFIFESDTSTTGTLLSVTCNTGTNVLPTSRFLASQTAGTGFVINLGTVTTNPACFSYFIVNQ